MEPLHYTNGDESAEDSSGEEAAEHELSLHDEGWAARALGALNALRKARQHYDAVLVARGAEVPAHRAVLAAASPYLLHALPLAPAGVGGAAALHRVDDVEPDALRDLVEFAYSGRLRVRDVPAALRLYRAAWRLRVEAARAHLAERLLRRIEPAHCLAVRALPDLAPPHVARLDRYIQDHFAEVCECPSFAALPLLRIEMLRETSADDGDESPRAVADAALVWLRDHNALDVDLEELCSRTHLLYVDEAGSLRDCGELPEARGDAAELQEYRREAAQRARGRRAPGSPPPAAQLGARLAPAECGVVAAARLEGAVRGTRALVALRGRLAAARVVRRAAGAGAGRAPAGVRRVRPCARAACRRPVRPRHQRVDAAPRHAHAARTLPARAPRGLPLRDRRQRRTHRTRHDGRVERGRGPGGGHVAGVRAPSVGAVARGGRGRRRGARAVRGGRVVRRRMLQARAALPRRHQCVGRGAAAARAALAGRRRALARCALGDRRMRRVALPRLHRDAGARRRRVGTGARAADGATFCGRGRVARRAAGGGRVGRRRLTAPHRVAARGRGGVARRPTVAPRARWAGPGRAARRALRGGRLRREGIPRVRRVSLPARRGVDRAVRAARAAAPAALPEPAARRDDEVAQ